MEELEVSFMEMLKGIADFIKKAINDNLSKQALELFLNKYSYNEELPKTVEEFLNREIFSDEIDAMIQLLNDTKISTEITGNRFSIFVSEIDENGEFIYVCKDSDREKIHHAEIVKASHIYKISDILDYYVPDLYKMAILEIGLTPYSKKN